MLRSECRETYLLGERINAVIGVQVSGTSSAGLVILSLSLDGYDPEPIGMENFEHT